MIFREFYKEIYRIGRKLLGKEVGGLPEGELPRSGKRSPSGGRRFAPRDDSAAAEDAGEECNVWYCVRGPPYYRSRIKFGKTPYYQSI